MRALSVYLIYVLFTETLKKKNKEHVSENSLNSPGLCPSPPTDTETKSTWHTNSITRKNILPDVYGFIF